jgi:hypothetical protein
MRRQASIQIPLSAQRRPLVIHSFSLNKPDPALAHVETLNDEPARLSNAHLAILGIHQGQEDLLASIFRKLFNFFFLDHEKASFGNDIPDCEGIIPRSAGLQQAQLGLLWALIAPDGSMFSIFHPCLAWTDSRLLLPFRTKRRKVINDEYVGRLNERQPPSGGGWMKSKPTGWSAVTGAQPGRLFSFRR